MKTATGEHHNPLDFNHDGQLSRFELAAGAIIGFGLLGVGILVGLAIAAAC